MWLTKAETWALADYHQQLDLVRYQTLTCYNGIKGSGCDRCDACTLRKNGLIEFLEDRTGTTKRLRIKLNL